MASIILGAVGSAVGGAVAGSVGAAIGTLAGRALGGSVDNAIFGGGKLADREGPRLADLVVQTSTYGKPIPLVYGMARLAGNVIWSLPITERATTTTSSSGGGKGGGGGGVSQTSTDYSYSISMAIAICEGPVDEVLRIWADAKQLDLSQGTYRIYYGDVEQEPDSFIEAHEGMGSTPAYRGLAYVVVEDFPLADYGNRIPNFTFEIRRRVKHEEYNGEVLEDLIKSITLIPGSGEFVYDTTVQYKVAGGYAGAYFAQQGKRFPINMHNAEGIANVKLALDQLQDTLPNLEWVSVVATWFGTNMDAGACVIKPGVEYQYGSTTSPNIWSVAGYDRESAHAITLIDEYSPRYGGTPDDASLIRLVNEIKARGLKVMFYPMFFMDVDDKPWRGRVTGSASDVASFFTKTNGYNAFITHYANLMDGKVDAFVIGSELIGLTKVASGTGVYPAVTALASLAVSVKSIMGSGTKITYAADWSEYHHTDGGWYNLDPLWASSGIDVVGIDAYFPLTNATQSGYDVDAVMEGWESGEGYDFYYTNEARTTTAPLGAAYAWKNIRWWWENNHVNPNGSTTSWVPESKPIWFTEYGFPSVDGATNQPNVFYDPTSSESYFPRFSKGRVDFRAQRLGLMATEQQWKDSDMIQRMFIWTWDARPFPHWPDMQDVWADGPMWKTGHWVQGKLGLSSLAAIVRDICLRAGLGAEDIDVSRLTDLVDGYVIPSTGSARGFIEQLMSGYFFDAVESDGILKFMPRGGTAVATIAQDDLLPSGESENGGGQSLITIIRQQEVELPSRVEVLYLNRTSNYQQDNQFSQRQATLSREVRTLGLPIVFSEQSAKIVAEQWLYTSWVNRVGFEFYVGMEYAALEPTDIVDVVMENTTHRIRIHDVVGSRPGIIRIRGVAEDVASYDVYLPPAATSGTTQPVLPVGETTLMLLDLPAFPNDNPQQGVLRIGAAGLHAGWRGAVVYRSDDAGGSYTQLAAMNSAMVKGMALTALGDGPTAVFDEVGTVEVLLLGNETLESASEMAVLNGANVALLGEEIFQFKTATLLSAGKYRLSGLLRGRLGTEYATAAHDAGDDFVLLNNRLAKDTTSPNNIGLSRLYKPVSVGATLGATDATSFSYAGRAFKPYAPVQVAGARDGGDNLTITWIRRTRLGGAWRDLVDVPLNEQDERYEIDILDGSTVVRTLTATTTEATYSAADQAADFGSAQSVLDVVVYQISAIIGRGIPASATL